MDGARVAAHNVKGERMPNQNNSGRNLATPDENRPSWRPDDEQHRSPRGWSGRDERSDPSDGDRASTAEPRWSAGRESRTGGHWDGRDDGYRMRDRYGEDRGYRDDRFGRGGGSETRFMGRDPQDSRGPQHFGEEPGGLEQMGYRRGYGSSEQMGYRGSQDFGHGEDRFSGHERLFGRSLHGRSGFTGELGDRGNLGHPGGGDFGQYYQRPQGMYESRIAHGRQDHWTDETRRGERSRASHDSHRGKGPRNFTRSDDRIRETVCEALGDDDQIDATNLDVTVKNGEVTLAGIVDDRRMKRLAEDCVESLPGVKDVQNQIRVHSERNEQSANTQSRSNQSESDTTTEKRARA